MTDRLFPCDEDAIFDYLKDKEGPWCIFANPMRDDCVFVGQDKPLEPYVGVTGLHGEAIYPAVPMNGFCFPQAMPSEVARRIVTRLNREKIIQN